MDKRYSMAMAALVLGTTSRDTGAVMIDNPYHDLSDGALWNDAPMPKPVRGTRLPDIDAPTKPQSKSLRRMLRNKGRR